MRILLIALDVLLLIVAAVLAWWWVLPQTTDPMSYAVLVLLTSMMYIFLFLMTGNERYHPFLSMDYGIKPLLLLWLSLGVALIVALWASKLSADFSRRWLSAWLLMGLGFLIFSRLLIRVVISSELLKSKWQKRIVLIGDGDALKNAISHWPKAPMLKLVDSIEHTDSRTEEEIITYLKTLSVDEVWLVFSLKDQTLIYYYLRVLADMAVNVRYLPDKKGMDLINHAAQQLGSFTLLDLSVSPMSVLGNRLLKWMEDKLLALMILMMISPILLIVAIGVKLSSPGPVFYRQERVGLNGIPFMMLKFRSMPVNAEQHGVVWGGAEKKTNTKFGQFIRKTSLDELPQFINVLKGDMSIVGPRPERTLFVEQFKHEIPNYMKKHLVKAGITGWAQVHGLRGDTCLHTRIEYDLWYIEHWSLWLDIKIIMLTLFKVFADQSAK